MHLARMEGSAGFEKLVALKTIHPHLATDRQFVEMFLDEARIASQINHPNVCTVFDFGETDGTYYMAMELVPGASLHEAIEAVVGLRDETLGRMFPIYAARILSDASEGLHAAHEQTGPRGQSLGIVHRDVSPQNLLITFEGAVKVTDFGCAKAIQRVSQTSTGTLKGKVGYAAPEQMRPGPIDRRADVWALGVCLWECLTFQRLFRRETDVQTALAVLQDPIPDAAQGRSWVPRELADIAARALERDPDARYATARDMGRDLRRFLTSTGYSVESAEIADFMRAALPDALEEHRRRAEAAGSISFDDDTPTQERAAVDPTADTVRLETVAPVNVPPPKTLRLRREDAHEGAGRGRSRSRWPIAAGLFVVLAIAGGAYAWQRGMLGTERGEASIDEASAQVGVRSSRVLTETADEAVAPLPHTREARAPASGEGTRVDRAARGEREPPSPAPATTVRVARGSANVQPAPTPSVDEPLEMAPPAPTTGTVRIVADEGWSLVVHEGRELGRTPLTVELPPGPQTLSLLPFGRPPGDTQQVRVYAGTSVTLRIAIREDRGTTALPPEDAP